MASAADRSDVRFDRVLRRFLLALSPACAFPPEVVPVLIAGILAHRANRWKSPVPMAVPMERNGGASESAENQGAWEQRRVLVALRIELAGLQLIGERGLDDVTVEQIAKDAGISVRTFFRYFRNVRDIVTAVPRARVASDVPRAAGAARRARASSTGSTRGSTRWTTSRDLSTPTGVLEQEAIERWSVIVREPARRDRGREPRR